MEGKEPSLPLSHWTVYKFIRLVHYPMLDIGGNAEMWKQTIPGFPVPAGYPILSLTFPQMEVPIHPSPLSTISFLSLGNYH